MLLDDLAHLVAVELGHHDIYQDQVGIEVADFRQRVETVGGEDDFHAGKLEENLRTAAYGFTIVHHQHAAGGFGVGSFASGKGNPVYKCGVRKL